MTTEVTDAPMHGTSGRMRSIEAVLDAIERATVAEFKQKRQVRIRPSALGKECARSLVYDFWWATNPVAPEGRMLRIFATGERVEQEIVDDLKRAGFEVATKDPANPSKQLSVSAMFGHLFGYLDGVCRDREAGGDWLVLECKSHNKANFAKLQKSGVEAAKPEHAAQMTVYMKLTGLKRGLYAAKCKDDESLHLEMVELDESYANRLIERALGVLDRKILPARIGPNAQYYKCRYCDHVDVCHNGVAPARNCRTCEFSKAIDGGNFACARHGCLIEKPLIENGCTDYERAQIFSA